MNDDNVTYLDSFGDFKDLPRRTLIMHYVIKHLMLL